MIHRKEKYSRQRGQTRNTASGPRTSCHGCRQVLRLPHKVSERQHSGASRVPPENSGNIPSTRVYAVDIVYTTA